ncbi:MAG: endonuclease/exonuclease/phosphatase family protein [Rhodospirillales bacterium]|nr:endonuclease/exonuclease/phosphatase family protein [Rhodospirillales bacterium]
MRLRIATFNVESLGEPRTGGASLEERLAVLRPQLLRLRADILCLQEVDAQHEGRGRHRRLAALEALLEDTPYAACAPITTTSRSKGGPRDKHNLVILSCLEIAEHRQILHAYVDPPQFRRGHDLAPPAGEGAGEQDMAIEWDRPFLYALVGLPEGRRLHLINVHLRAPRAAFMPGGKGSGGTWRTMAGWAEGFFVAAVKRAGQALEVRLFIDKLFDEDPEALIAVCGDFNAGAYEIPLRTIRGDEEDAGNPHLALRTLVPVERTLADSRQFSVVHHGRPQMLDHILVSRPLLAWYRGVEIHNEALGDELVTSHAVRGTPESFHAPMVAEFRFEGPAPAQGHDPQAE